MRPNTLSILIPKLILTDKNQERRARTYFHPNPIWSLPLPRPMDYFDLHQSPNILVKLIHDKVHVEKVIEVPALANHWITKDVTQSDCVDIVALTWGKALDVS
jgi:hypothetical protein